MAEFKMPKYVCKDKPISLDECYRELSDMTYESPVKILYQGVQTKIEGDILEAIHSYGIDVDKGELVKALKYDRDQYQKGFADGCRGRTDIDKIKAEVARAIFEEIEELLKRTCERGYCGSINDLLAELKKKYTNGD